MALDTTAPDVAPTAAPEAFSPDGDRAADTTAIGWVAGEPATATVKIYRGTTLIRSFAVTRAATTGAIRWDGKDRSGRRVADGTYQARVQLTDAGGNRGTGAVAVKVDGTAGWLRWGPTAFYPQDGDTLAKTSKVTFRLSRTASTTLQVVDATGAVVRTAWTNRRLAAGTPGWTWDGRDGARAFVAPGTYTAVLTATSALGTTTLRRSIVVDAFSVRPSATTLAAGQTLTVKFTTVEPLKTRPVVTFTQPGRAPVVKTATLVSTGRYTASFNAAGAAGAATLRIAAKDSPDAGTSRFGRSRSSRLLGVARRVARRVARPPEPPIHPEPPGPPPTRPGRGPRAVAALPATDRGSDRRDGRRRALDPGSLPGGQQDGRDRQDRRAAPRIGCPGRNAARSGSDRRAPAAAGPPGRRPAARAARWVARAAVTYTARMTTEPIAAAAPAPESPPRPGRRLGRAPDVQRGGQRRADLRGDPEHLPGATLLIVDDGSPDGTGRLRTSSPRQTRGSASVTVPPLGPRTAYSTGSGSPSGGATIVIQMDADLRTTWRSCPG